MPFSKPAPVRSSRAGTLVQAPQQEPEGALLTRDPRAHENAASSTVLGTSSPQDVTSHPRVVW